VIWLHKRVTGVCCGVAQPTATWRVRTGVLGIECSSTRLRVFGNGPVLGGSPHLYLCSLAAYSG
jgi:hypothetical protein